MRQLGIRSPVVGSRKLWVWTTLVLLLAVATTTPGGGQVQAAETPQQQTRNLSLLNNIYTILDELLVKLNRLLNHVAPTTTAPSVTSNIPSNTETTTPESSQSVATSTDTSTSDSTGTATSESTTVSTGTATSESTPESTGTATSESTPASTGTATSESTSVNTGTATSENTPASTGTATSESTPVSTGTATSESTPESTGTATSESTPESTGTATSESTPASTGTATSESTPESTGTATATSESTPVSTGTATATSESTPVSTGTATSESTAASTGTVTSESTPESTGTATSESTPASTGTATPESTPVSTGTATSESTPVSTGTATSESTPESTGTATSESTPESTGTATSESTPASTGTATSGSTPESTGISTSTVTETRLLDDERDLEDDEKNNPGTSNIAKRSLRLVTLSSNIPSSTETTNQGSPSESTEDNGICIPAGDDVYCNKLVEVMATIEDVTGRLEEEEASQDMVTQLQTANTDMDDILDHADEIEFHEDIEENIESRIEDVEDAKEKLQENIDEQNSNSQTLVIVLGSVGGFIVVALVATLIFVYYKKRKANIDDKKKLNTEYVPINSFKEGGHDNPNFYPEVVTAQKPAQPQEVLTYGTPSHLQPMKSEVKDNSNSRQNIYETPSYSRADDVDSQNVPQRTSYRGGYAATDTQGQQPTYPRPAAADKVPRPNLYGNTNKQPPRPASVANYDTTDHRSPSRPTSKTDYDYGRKPNRSGYENEVRVPRVAPKPQSLRPYSPPARSYDDEANDPYSLDARGNVKRMSGTPVGGLRRIDN